MQPNPAAPWRTIEDLVEHGQAPVNGTEIHYVRAGPRDAPPLVLLHGFPESWLMWRALIPTLAQQYHVVAADLRGYGDSAKPAGQAGYDKGTMAADIRELIAYLGLVRPVVIGHDRGARVTRRLALDAPAAVRGVALLDILPAEWVYDHFNDPALVTRMWHWIFQLVPDLPEQLIPGHEAEYLGKLFSRAPGVLDQLRAEGVWDEYLRVFSRPEALAAMLSDYRATFALDVPYYRALRAAGTKLAVPALILWGDHGNLGGRPALEIWREVASTVQGSEIPDCGHYLPEEQPAIVRDHLLSFITTCFAEES